MADQKLLFYIVQFNIQSPSYGDDVFLNHRDLHLKDNLKGHWEIRALNNVQPL